MVALGAYLQMLGEERLGGVFSLSGMKINNEYDHEEASQIKKGNTPMFIYHGKKDEVYPSENAMASYKYLTDKIYKDPNHKKNLKMIIDKEAGNEFTHKEWA